MYAWTLVGHDLRRAVVCSGCSDNLAGVMRHAEPYLVSYQAFACRIVEVVPRLSVTDLECEFQPTGRTWLGRRTTTCSVRWTESFESPDPAAPYSFGSYRFAPYRFTPDRLSTDRLSTDRLTPEHPCDAETRAVEGLRSRR
jgi:hypothetical protein